MKRQDGHTTSPLLLKRVADWADRAAWYDFFGTYDRLVRLWCGGYGLENAAFEDLCQQIWIELADRMRTYQYDPGKTFRGWLRQFCHSRTLDQLRRRKKKEAVGFVDDDMAKALAPAVDATDDEEQDLPTSRRLLLLSQAEEVQRTVKERLATQTWQAFWRIAVDGRSVRQAADDLGMSYAAVFAAQKRVGKMLRTEGDRQLTQTNRELSATITPDMS